MTKFTKERLEEIAELARKATYQPCAMHMTNLLVVCDSEVIEEMSRQLLAGMEQEPLYQVRHGDKWRDLNKAQYDDHVNLGAEGLRIVYAAPQLPQTVVPEELLYEIDNLLTVCRIYACRSRRGGSERDIPRTEKAQEKLRACRAAMLQGGKS